MKDQLAGRYAASQLTVQRASGAHLEDREGGRFTDFVLGNLTQIFGHGELDCSARVTDALRRYTNVGDQPHIGIHAFARRLLAISRKDSLRFTNSGSEAAHLAIRLARAVTGRPKILRFVGHYHGWFNEEIGSFLRLPSSAGLTSDARHSVIQVNWNNLEEVASAFEHQGSEIAAIICEPILAHAGTIPPCDGFLEQLRSLANTHGCALIFDECITGFRVAMGGAQSLYGIDADLVVYSKALSNGVPLGVVAGTSRFMAAAADWSVFHASSYDCNPLSLAMGEIVLDGLESGSVLQQIDTATTYFSTAMLEILRARGHSAICQSVPGFFQIFFTERARITSYDEAMASDWRKNKRLVELLLAERIVASCGDLRNDDGALSWLGSWFVSARHDKDTLDTVLDAVDRVAKKI